MFPARIKKKNVWFYRWIGLGCLVAIRGLLWLAYSFTPIPKGPISDSWVYLELARGWLAFHTWPLEAAFHSPLYPYVLGILLKIFGGSLMGVLLLQNVAAVLGSLLILEWIHRLHLPSRCFWFGLALLMLSGPLMTFEWRLFPVNFALWGQILLLELLWRMRREEQSLKMFHLYGFISAVLISFLILLRSNFLLLLPLLLFWGWRKARRQKAFRWALLYWILVPVLSALPFLQRNAVLGAGYTLAANSGITFLHGNQPHSRGGYTSIPGVDTDVSRQNLASIEEALNPNPKQSENIDRRYWKQGLRFLTQNPGSGLRLLGRKFWLWIYPGETGGDISFGFERQRIPSLWPLSLVNFSLLFVLSWFAFGFRKKERFPFSVNLALILVSFLTCLIFYVKNRYRIPAWPLLVFPACLGFDVIFHWVEAETPKRKSRAAFVVILGGLLMISGWTIPLTRAGQMIGWHNWATAWERAENPEAARAAYQKVLELESTHRATLENLSRLRLRQGELEEAEKILKTLLRNHPESYVGHNNLSVVNIRRKKWTEALRSAQRASELRPGVYNAYINQAVANLEMKRIPETCSALRKAISLQPHRRLPLRFRDTCPEHAR